MGWMGTFPDNGRWQKGGAIRLQPHLILRVLHGILIFAVEIITCQSVNPKPSSSTTFDSTWNSYNYYYYRIHKLVNKLGQLHYQAYL